MPALGGVRQPSPPDCFDEVNRELNNLPEDQALTSTFVARAYRTKVPKTSKVQAQLIDPKFEIIKCAFDEWDGQDINKHTTFDDFTIMNSIGNPVGSTFPWLERAVYESKPAARKKNIHFSLFLIYITFIFV
jgi:hypothetical protein